MSEQENRDTLERYRQEFFERQDIDAIADLMHDDYVEEYPQSGEKILGKDNARTVYVNYPGLPTLIDYGYELRFRRSRREDHCRPRGGGIRYAFRY